MSERYPGGFITKSPPALNPALGNAAPGIWTMDQVMQAVKNGTWPAYDPYFEYTTLLLHGNGTNGAQNNTFLDASTNNFTITRNGNATQGTFSPYGDLWSNYFDGSSDYFTFSSNASMDFGTGNFTIEGWFYTGDKSVSGGASRTLIGNSGNSYTMQVYLSTAGYMTFGNTGSTYLQGATDLANNAWHHFAISRTGTGTNQIGMWVDGVRVAQGTNNQNYTSGTIYLGAFGTTDGFWNGYISNLRIVKGSAVYDPANSSITVPTAPLTAITNTSLLTCQSNRFIDNSSNNFTITRNGDVSVQRFSPFSPTAAYSAATVGGSGYFDGTGDYLTSSCGNVGTGDFTIEGWFYFNTTPSTMGLFQASSTSGGFVSNQTANLAVATSSSSTWQIYAKNTYTISSSTSVPVSSWGHMALVRNGTTTVLYINGAAVITLTSDSTNYSTSFIGLGGIYDNTSYLLNGFLANFRVVVGTAVYTAAFTPPTTPLTAITNTSLLLNFTNAGIIDNAMMNDLETVGNAQISTSVKKYGTGSLAFDGSGDYLDIASTPNLTFGLGDFTIEFWIKTSQTGFNIMNPSTATGSGYWGLLVQSSELRWNNAYNVSNLWAINASAILDNNWHHVAVCRSGSTTRIFFDGSLQGNPTDSNSYGGVAAWRIGSGNLAAFNGFVDDLRITKGVARYTANFTPPTSQLQDQ